MDEIVRNKIYEIPLTKLIRAKTKVKRRLATWEIISIILGTLIGVPIIIGLLSGVFAVYVSLWSVAAVFYLMPIVLILSSAASLIAFFPLIFTVDALNALFVLGGGLISLGLVLPFYFVAKYTAKFMLLITKETLFLVKKILFGKDKS